jgi:hypothetical protein
VFELIDKEITALRRAGADRPANADAEVRRNARRGVRVLTAGHRLRFNH